MPLPRRRVSTLHAFTAARLGFGGPDIYIPLHCDYNHLTAHSGRTICNVKKETRAIL